MRGKGRSGDEVLPEAELEVLAVLHTRGASDASEIREALKPFRPMTHASVLTLLGRLETKELVSRATAAVGRAFVAQVSDLASGWGLLAGDHRRRPRSAPCPAMVPLLMAGNAKKMLEKSSN